MYQLDENYLDQKYFLRPIGDNDQQWYDLEKKLQINLRQAADRCYEQQLITKDERDEFHISGKEKKSVEFHHDHLDFSYCTRNLPCIGK